MKRIICWCALLFCAACNPAPKLKQTVLAVVGSPTSKRELLIILQGPGALGSNSTAVFLSDKGNQKLGDLIFVVKGEPKVEAHWLSDNNAVISHDAKKEDVFTSAGSSDGVSFEYESMKKTDFLDAAHNLKQP